MTVRESSRRLRTMILGVALLAAVATPAAAQPGGHPVVSDAAPLAIGETFTIRSRVLGETRRINVYVPPAFTGDSAPALPVLYMPDGGIGEDFLHVAGILQVSIGNGTMRPFLLVGIENTDRRRDMTGPTSSAEDRKVAPRAGGSPAFRSFIRSELMPTISARYRASGETAIVGESMAGLFVVETFFRERDLFDTYIAFDPSLWWDDGRLVRTAGAALRADPTQSATIYLASSDEPELATLTRQLADSLESAKAPAVAWQYFPMPEESHGSIYHPAALRAFRLLFKPKSGAP